MDWIKSLVLKISTPGLKEFCEGFFENPIIEEGP
tara:strand:+ start:330 stop:431 length:102 start_codon:yes stop_codon:yes gene_type:complete